MAIGNAQHDYTSFIALETMLESSMKIIRGKRVMLASDVARIYRVSPEYLCKQVSKNRDCFPKSFMFKLNAKEQSAYTYKGEGFPYAFTEHGILMAGGKLKSEQAIKIHVQFIRYFVQLFNQTLENKTMKEELDKLTRGRKILDTFRAMSEKK